MSDYCTETAITVVQNGVFCLAAFRSMAILTKRIALWKIGFLAVLLMVVNSVPVSGNYELLISESCDHFNLAEGQSGNAFYYDGRVCCLCKIGTKFTSVCNEDDPLSTGCDPCGKDEYRDFEPHMQPECEPQIEKYCKDPWVLSKGSITKATRCICKPGFRELGKMCVPIQKSIPPVTAPPVIIGKITENSVATKFTTTSMFIEPTTAPHKTTEGIDTTTAYISTTVINGIETSASSDITDDPSFNITEKYNEISSVTLWIIFLAIALVIVAVLTFIWIYWKKYHDKPKKTDNESRGPTPGSTPMMASSRALMRNGRRSVGCFSTMSRREEIVTTNGEVHEQRVDEIDGENGGDSRSSVNLPFVERQSAIIEDQKSSNHQEIEPLLIKRNIENDIEQKNMAAPSGIDLNPGRIRRELSIATGDDDSDSSQGRSPVGISLVVCRSSAPPNPCTPNDPRLPRRHKVLRGEAIDKIVPNIYHPDLIALGHWMFINENDLDDIKENHKNDGRAEVARRVFRRGLEMCPNLSLYDFHDKVRELGLGYMKDVFEDFIKKLEDPEEQPEEQH